MKIIRRQARQGHPVPNRILPVQGPFPREILAEPKMVVYDDDLEDSEDEDYG